MSSYEVGIIGAGIHGASVAYHLGRVGVPTVILERDTPAAGPTGRSSAVCRAGYTNRFLARMAYESIEMFRHFAELTGGGDAGYRQTGMLYLYRPEDVVGLDALVADLRSIGIDVSIVDAEGLTAKHPQVVLENGGAALWEASGGHADPAGTTRALFDDAARHGVDTRVRAAVVRIEGRRQGGAILSVADGTTVECERLLIAAGPWTAPLARQVGAELPLIVERHFVATFAWGKAPPVPYVIGDVAGGYYMKPEGAEQFGLGTLLAEDVVDPDAFQQAVGTEEALALAEPAVRRMPALASSAFVGGWASLYDVSPDWQPVIGEIADGIFISAGTSGHGFKLAPALARHVAGLVSGTEYDPSLQQFGPARFVNGGGLSAGFGEARILG